MAVRSLQEDIVYIGSYGRVPKRAHDRRRRRQARKADVFLDTLLRSAGRLDSPLVRGVAILEFAYTRKQGPRGEQ